MQKTKRLFSALLAIVMLVSMFTFTTSAGAPLPTGSAKVSIAYEVVNSNGDVVTAVNPGETVTVNVYANAANASDTLNSADISIFYNSSVYTYVEGSLKWVGLADWVDATSSSIDFYGKTEGFHATILGKVAAGSAELNNNWDKMAFIKAIPDLSGSAYSVQANADNVMMSIDLKVSDTAAIGTVANVGCYSAAHYVSSTKSYCNIKTASTGSRIKSGVVAMPTTTELTVAAAEEPFPSTSIVKPLKGQIRFNKKDDGNFASFDVRSMAVISKADFESKFAEGEAAEAEGVIKDIGFVYAAASRVSGMTFGNVKKVVEGGETVDGYVKKGVNFISTSIDSPNYVFTCVVTGMTAAAYEDTLLAVAYIAYADADGNAVYCYYPAVQEVSYSGLIDTYYQPTFGEAFAK